MTISNITTLLKSVALSSCLIMASNSSAEPLALTVDSFTKAELTDMGFPRMFLSDESVGGGSRHESAFSNGILALKGEIVPPRGQPGWVSSVLPLSEMGAVKDLSQFSGVKIKIKINKGNISLSANSAEVTNYDYHTAAVAVQPDGQFHEISIPFESMQRTWSAQTKLDTTTINSLSIVAYDLSKSSFDFAIDNVSLY